MTEAVIFLALFYAAYRVMGGMTHLILFFAAIVNLVVYPLTSEYSVLLPASVDFVAVSLIIGYGGRYWRQQTALLCLAMLCHLLIEMDRLTGSDLIFSHYGAIITTITIGQLLGAGHAIINRLSERAYNFLYTDVLCGDANHSAHFEKKEGEKA